MQELPQKNDEQLPTCKMDEQDKFWYIHSHWADYEKWMKAHKGKPFGFPFPDGTCVERDVDDDCFGN